MTRPIGIGIVGSGRMAARMAGAISTCDATALRAVMSTSTERGEAFAGRWGLDVAVDSVEALAATPGVDLVYVANASRDHAPASLAALAAGVPVLCEKPFATDAASARAVIDAARDSGVFFMEAMWTHALPSHRRLEMRAASGELGRPLHFSHDFGYPATETTRRAQMGPDAGGVLSVRACYGVSLALRLLGPHEEVAADPGAAGDAFASLRIHHRDGGISRIAASAVSLLSNAATLSCERGFLALAPPVIGSEMVLSARSAPAGDAADGKEGLRARLRRRPAARRLWGSVSGPRRDWAPYGADQYHPLLLHVAAILREGRTESPLMPREASLGVALLLDAARNAGGG